MVGLGYLGEIFVNPNPNRFIWLFLLPTDDWLLTDFGAACGSSIRAGGLVGLGQWIALPTGLNEQVEGTSKMI